MTKLRYYMTCQIERFILIYGSFMENTWSTLSTIPARSSITQLLSTTGVTNLPTPGPDLARLSTNPALVLVKRVFIYFELYNCFDRALIFVLHFSRLLVFQFHFSRGSS